ncbi:unnamed protein product [Aphanomyces euteiches]
MSDEETKSEAGETVVALTEEERLYRDAVSDFYEARKSLKQWEANHKEQGFSPTDPNYLLLKQELNDAKQWLKDTNQLLKDARAAFGETSKRQKVEKIGPKWKNEDESEGKVAYEGEAKWEWKPEVEPVYSLVDFKMFFVNRDRAVQQLQNIHSANYVRARDGNGLDWNIPIADNVIGLGKSFFGNHYIRKCREVWKGVNEPLSDFQKPLTECHTVRLLFKRGDLLENAEKKLRCQLFKKLRGMFIKPPAILPDETKPVDVLLEKVADEVGPLFIVLDEIGAAFEHKDLDVAVHRFSATLASDQKQQILQKALFPFLD